MKSLSFSPASIQVKVGQTVKWTNDDTPPHNVAFQSPPSPVASSPQVMNPGTSFSVKFTKPGTYNYICTIHPFMHGTVVVSG